MSGWPVGHDHRARNRRRPESRDATATRLAVSDVADPLSTSWLVAQTIRVIMRWQRP